MRGRHRRGAHAMSHSSPSPSTPASPRRAALAMSADEFRHAGHALVDTLASFLDDLPGRPVTPGETPAEVRAALGAARPLPGAGAPATEILERRRAPACRPFALQRAPALPRLHHVVAGTDRHAGGSARGGDEPERGRVAPVADGQRDRSANRALDRGAGRVSPGLRRALRERRQHGQFRRLPGGARRGRRAWRVRATGVGADDAPRLRVYASAETHTWIQKAADLSGLGTDAIRWIPTDPDLRLDTRALREAIAADRDAGEVPMLVVGTADR